MSYRFMRIMVFFDLPSVTYSEQKEYRKFRKLLINEGFIMMQESVYYKLALNNSIVESIKKKLEKGKPKEGLIQILTVTEKQFGSMETIIGSVDSNKLDTTERLVIF